MAAQTVGHHLEYQVSAQAKKCRTQLKRGSIPHTLSCVRLRSVGPPFQLHRNSQVAIPHLHNASPVPRPLITMRMEWGGPCCQTGTRQGRTASLLAPTPHDRCIGNAHNLAAAQAFGKKWGSPGASFITNAMKEDPLGPCRHPSIIPGTYAGWITPRSSPGLWCIYTPPQHTRHLPQVMPPTL